MNEHGDYVILSVEKDEVYDHTSYVNFCSHITDDDSSIDPQKKACRSLMILAPEYPKYDLFARNVTHRNYQAPFRVPRYDGPGNINIRVPIYAGLAHDAVLLLAEGMTRVMKAPQKNDSDPDYIIPDPHSGSQVIQELKNVEYHSKLAITLFRSDLMLLNTMIQVSWET